MIQHWKSSHFSQLLKNYEKRTPRTMLPDFLMNNYLEDPALSLVKSVKDISEIWDRLRLAEIWDRLR